MMATCDATLAHARARPSLHLEQTHELLVEVQGLHVLGLLRKRANFSLKALLCNILFHLHYDSGCLDAEASVQQQARAHAPW